MNTIARNTATQVLARCYSLAFSLGITLLLARHLGVGDYGSFVVVLMLIGLAGLVADLGTQTVLVRDATADSSPDVRAAAGLRLALGLASSLVALGVAAAVYGAEGRVLVGVAIALPTIVLNASAGTAAALLQARLRLDLIALVEACSQTISLMAIGVLVVVGASFDLVVVATVVTAAVHATFLSSYARGRGRLLPRVDVASWRRLLRAALPVGGSVLVATVYFRVDALIVAALRGPAAAGIYGIAYRPVEALGGFPPLFVASVFPVLVLAVAAQDEERLRTLLQRSGRILAGAAIPTALLGIALAPLVVRILGGHAYATAATPMRLLLAGLPLLALNGLLGAAMVALHRQRDALVLNATLLGFNVALNLVVVPRYGATGAATAATVSELLLLAAQIQLLRRRTAPAFALARSV